MSGILENSNKTVFVSGNFFVLHPGHIRLLKFAAECGDKLVVGVNTHEPSKNYAPAEERALALKELGMIDSVVILDAGVDKYIESLKPDIVIKGKEYESRSNSEVEILRRWGGKIIFASGDAENYSYYDSRNSDSQVHSAQWSWPHDYLLKNQVKKSELEVLLSKFETLDVLVVGDLIVDEYTQCEALGMSREDPTLVVSPQQSMKYIGGAGIVAAHASQLGAKVKFISVVGDDDLARWSEEKLKEYKVEPIYFYDESRPTTLKKRYRVGSKNLLRVSTLRQHEISVDLQQKIAKVFDDVSKNMDLVVFSDFSYGVLPRLLARKLIDSCKSNNIIMAADSQSSSQIGDLNKFTDVHIITPTEYEARLALDDQQQGLHEIVRNLLDKFHSELVAITLGSLGLIYMSKNNHDLNILPAINKNPVDISGAGDSLLITSSLSFTAAEKYGLNKDLSFLMGSIGAALQVDRLGNIPLRNDEIKHLLDNL